MKIKPNAISIIEEILNNPEKDFTEENIYTQLVQVTEEDFTNAERLIKAYVRDGTQRKLHLKELNEKRSTMDDLNLESFKNDLLRAVRYSTKRWNTQHDIVERINRDFPAVSHNDYENIFYRLKNIISTARHIQIFREKIDDHITAIRKNGVKAELQKLDPTFEEVA